MARQLRIDVAGLYFHVLNRANGKLDVFKQQIDYDEFLHLIEIAIHYFEVDLFSFCIMPTHWHMVCSPKKDGEMGKFIKWVSQVHAQRWHVRHNNVGTGHFYQDRYKSFLIEDDRQFLSVCRYIEMNPVKADLVKDAKDWKWSSVSNKKIISKWPIEKPKNYNKLLKMGSDPI